MHYYVAHSQPAWIKVLFGLPSQPSLLRTSSTMPPVHTTSLVLAENMRVTRSISKLAAHGCAAIIVRRPLFNRTMSMNIGAPLSAKRKQDIPMPPPAKPTVSVPLPYKTGFGFIPAGAPRMPEERERLRKERLAFFRRSCVYQRKNLPKFKFHRVPTFPCEVQYTREYVGLQTDYFRILPSPALLAPPATDYGGQIIDTDTLAVIPGIQLHVPPAWDKRCQTDRPAHDTEVDEAMLFVPPTTPSGDLYAEDLARYFPVVWREVLAEHKREVQAQMKRRVAEVRKVGGLCRL